VQTPGPNFFEQFAPYGQIGGLILIVVIFLRHIRDGEKDRKAGHEQREKIMQDIATKSNECSEKCAASMAQSAEVMRQTTTALQQNTTALAKVSEHLGEHRRAG